MDSMKKYKTFEAWRDVHIRSGDGEKFRAKFEEVHGGTVRRRRRTRAEMQAANEDAD